MVWVVDQRPCLPLWGRWIRPKGEDGEGRSVSAVICPISHGCAVPALPEGEPRGRRQPTPIVGAIHESPVPRRGYLPRFGRFVKRPYEMGGWRTNARLTQRASQRETRGHRPPLQGQQRSPGLCRAGSPDPAGKRGGSPPRFRRAEGSPPYSLFERPATQGCWPELPMLFIVLWTGV